MPFQYQAFGLPIFSDVAMPELSALQIAEEAPLFIQADRLSDHHDFLKDAPPVQWHGTSDALYLFIRDVAHFKIAQGQHITYQPVPDCDPSLLRLFLLGSCLGAVLQQRGYITLHGNAITLDHTHCTIIVGHSGAGKSTTAAHYFQKGASILADDVCAISIDALGKPQVIPSFPQIKLWQASTEFLQIDNRQLRKIAIGHDKFSLNTQAGFSNTPLTLANIIELDPEQENPRVLQGIAKIRTLINHSYRYQFLSAMNLQASHHRKLLTIASCIPMNTMGRKHILDALFVTMPPQ